MCEDNCINFLLYYLLPAHIQQCTRLVLNGGRLVRYSNDGPNLLRFLLELLDRSLVDTAALVDEMAGGGGFPGVDVADNHDVDVSLLLRHGCYCLASKAEQNRKIIVDLSSDYTAHVSLTNTQNSRM